MTTPSHDPTPTEAAMREARVVINATMRDHVCDQRESKCCGDAILTALSSAGIDCEGWRTIESAKKDRTVIWAALHPDIYPRIEPERKDLERLNGVQVPLQHPGVYEKDGRKWDHGWTVAAPVGYGGIPDEWIAGWRPLPPLASGGG